MLISCTFATYLPRICGVGVKWQLAGKPQNLLTISTICIAVVCVTSTCFRALRCPRVCLHVRVCVCVWHRVWFVGMF